MKKVLLSLSFVLFSFFTTSQVFASAFDCSFSEQQLRDLTVNQFRGLDQKGKVELSLLFHASTTDNGAAKLINMLQRNAFNEVRRYSTGVPPTIFTSVGVHQRSVKGMVLETTVKAMSMGFIKEVPVQILEKLLGISV